MDLTRCDVCGKGMSEDELAKVDDVLVCPMCRPLYTERLREVTGDTAEEETTHFTYGGFWIRAAAKLIDGMIFAIISALLKFARGAMGSADELAASSILIDILYLAINFGYVVYFLGKYGATPGKMVCNLKVIRSDGRKISYGQACGRYFAEMLSSLIFCVGYFIAAFDDEKRTLHDRICDTRVIRINT